MHSKYTSGTFAGSTAQALWIRQAWWHAAAIWHSDISGDTLHVVTWCVCVFRHYFTASCQSCHTAHTAPWHVALTQLLTAKRKPKISLIANVLD